MQAPQFAVRDLANDRSESLAAAASELEALFAPEITEVAPGPTVVVKRKRVVRDESVSEVVHPADGMVDRHIEEAPAERRPRVFVMGGVPASIDAEARLPLGTNPAPADSIADVSTTAVSEGRQGGIQLATLSAPRARRRTPDVQRPSEPIVTGPSDSDDAVGAPSSGELVRLAAELKAAMGTLNELQKRKADWSLDLDINNRWSKVQRDLDSVTCTVAMLGRSRKPLVPKAS